MLTPTTFPLFALVLALSEASPYFGRLGGNSTGEKIVGGTNAVAGEFPWQVSIQDGSFHFCGGSILSDIKIATAAHCCEDYLNNWSSLRIIAGAHNLQLLDEPTRQIRSVSPRPIIHPSYNTPNTLDNDACILLLSTRLTMSARVAAIAPCSTDPPGGLVCTASGWGDTSNNNPPAPTILQKLNMHMVPAVNCSSRRAAAICAGGIRNEDICDGDSGGPLVCGSGTSRCLAGAVSYSTDDCGLGEPAGFASVAQLYKFYTQYP